MYEDTYTTDKDMYTQGIDWETVSQLHVLYGIHQSWMSLKAFASIAFREQQSWLLGSNTSTIRQSFVFCTNSLRSWSRSRMEC